MNKKSEYIGLEDNEIIRLILEKNETDAFEVLYRKYYDRVLDKCYSLIRNREQAQEFAEDIFSKAYEKLYTMNNAAYFSSWLYSLAYNHCIDYLRQKKKLHYPEWNRQNEIPEIIDEGSDELVDIDYDNLMSVLDQIHPEEKALLMMKYHDDISIRDIGRSLRISEDAAKMRIKRARARVLYIYSKKFGDSK